MHEEIWLLGWKHFKFPDSMKKYLSVEINFVFSMRLKLVAHCVADPHGHNGCRLRRMKLYLEFMYCLFCDAYVKPC